MGKKYYEYIDLFRTVLCIAVLLYHLDLLQGGFLAVCCFFVLSGYLATNSLLRRDKIDLKKHYLSRFKKIYLPLLMVVFITVAFISLQQDVVWVSLKPETTSVLFGYNNFWQIQANLDYFARHTNSPFTHLWYMAILLQFEIVYPVIFLLLQKTKKYNCHLPSIISGILALGFSAWFIVYSNQAPISAVYYNTFARVFSLFIGVNACFIHNSLDKNICSNEKINVSVFYCGLLSLIILFFVLTSLISCIIIECAVAIVETNTGILDQFCKGVAGISYEVYLVQYPVIYLYQIVFANQENVYINTFVISLITFVVAILIHLVFITSENIQKLQKGLIVCFLVISSFGGYQYIMAEDYTEEMKQLEAELAVQAEEMEKQNLEYDKKTKQENDAWEELLAQLDPDEETVKQSVADLPVVFVGDSVMLGATPNLREMFGNGYVDAKVSRTGWVMAKIIKSLNVNGPVVIHSGTNGDVPESVKDEIMKNCGDNDVFWLTVTNDKDVNVNEKLKKFVDKYDNAYLIDWQQHSKGHEDWFYGDRIHLRSEGKKAYTSLIFNSIYEVKLKELENIRNDAIEERENQLKRKISFFGNDLLLGVYDQLNDIHSDANFVADKDLNKEMLLTLLSESLEHDALNYNVVLVVDASFEMDSETFKSIKELCEERKVYIFSTVSYDELNNDCVYSLGEVLKVNPNYYSPDKIRLSEEGNVELYNLIVEKMSDEIVGLNS